MKKIMLAVLMLSALIATAKTTKTVDSELKKVTVFTTGAQLFRSATVTISPGSTDLVFSGLASSINPGSIQAGGKGNFIILEVKHQIRYPDPSKEKENTLPKTLVREMGLLDDSITETGFEEEALAEKHNALMLEKNMIQKNKLATGEGKNDSLAVFKQAMELFRLKLNDINAQLMDIKKQQRRLGKEKSRMNARLEDLKKYSRELAAPKKYEPVNEVIVTVSADDAATGTVEISYMVSNAGWTPAYDLRTESTSAPVHLTYKANIFQSTGEAWNDVKLKLSTSNPNRSATKPELPVWYLNYFFKQQLQNTSAGAPALLFDRAESQKDLAKEIESLSPAQSAANYSQIVETMTNVEFDVKLPYTIPSDGIVHMIPVKRGELPATYTHYLVPKLESEAFLLASVTGWEQLSLLPGTANIFYEGTFVGTTVLNPAVINDTLHLSMGRDHGITVKRTKLPITEKNKLLGDEVIKTIAWELKIKNNKSGKINLVVEDQVPVSQNKEIKVEMKNKNGAEFYAQTGKLVWTTTLASREQKDLGFSYEVAFDRNKPISMY